MYRAAGAPWLLAWRHGCVVAARLLGRGSRATHAGAGGDSGSSFEALDRLLSVAEGFPAGAARNELRRSICALIESSPGSDRRATLGRVLSGIDGVQKRRAAGRSDATDPSPAAVEQLLDAVQQLVKA